MALPRPLVLVVLAAGALVVPSSAQATGTQYYVSLGDSYAAGAQVDASGATVPTRHGFADQVPALARKRGYRLKLVNFGCGGETTSSILTRTASCGANLAVGGRQYAGRTQIGAAERFMRAHKGRIVLVTISIGGNDVTSCAKAADPIPCVATAVAGIKQNVTALARRVRKAAGPKARIVGTTYPDVILGEALSPDPAEQQLATLSVTAFKALVNPALAAAYKAAKGALVDVTAATGAYGSMSETTALAPYGTIPTPVAKVCELTYYCSDHDIHARTAGYAVIAQLVAGRLPRRG